VKLEPVKEKDETDEIEKIVGVAYIVDVVQKAENPR